MTANPLERAVIEAARKFCDDESWDQGDPFPTYLFDAVVALAAHKASLAPGIQEGIGWHEVAEGDELRGNNGKFYPVVRTLKVQRGRYDIVVRVGETDMVLTRPTEKDPTATVRRGPTGRAVDDFVHVFSSNAGRRH